MRLQYDKRSEVRLVSRIIQQSCDNETPISESQVLEAKRTKICWTNYPLS